MSSENKEKTVIKAFYQGGTKLRASTVHTASELETIIKNAKKNNEDAVVETVTDDPEVDVEKIYLTRNGLLFYAIVLPKKKGIIEVAPAGSVPGSETPPSLKA